MASQTTQTGIGFSGLLTIAFIVLKLVGVIDWPWLWVLSPIWITFFLYSFVLFIALIVWKFFSK